MAEETNKTAPNTNLEYANHTREEWNEERLDNGGEPKNDVNPEDETTVSLQTYEAQKARNEERKKRDLELAQQMVAAANDAAPTDTTTDGVNVDGSEVTETDSSK